MHGVQQAFIMSPKSWSSIFSNVALNAVTGEGLIQYTNYYLVVGTI